MKIVGKRSGKTDSSPEEANILLNTVRQLRGDRGICPKGVYKFKSFEEANEWMYEMIAKSSQEARH